MLFLMRINETLLHLSKIFRMYERDRLCPVSIESGPYVSHLRQILGN